jgi:hypothetical protein
LKHVIEGKIGGIEVTVRKRRRSRQLLDVLKEVKGCCKLKEEALDGIPLKTLFGSAYEPVVGQTME